MSSMFNPDRSSILRRFVEQDQAGPVGGQPPMSDAGNLFPNMARNRDQLDALWRRIAQVLSDNIRQGALGGEEMGQAIPGMEMPARRQAPASAPGRDQMGSWERSMMEQGLAPDDQMQGDRMPGRTPDGGLPAQRPDPGAGNEDLMNAEEIGDLLYQVGFRGEQLATMIAIAFAESDGNPRAHNPDATTGDNSYGLFQINMLDTEDMMMGEERRERYGLSSDEELWDPMVNARIAYDFVQRKIARGDDPFEDWTTYKNDKHLPFWDVASRAAAAVERQASGRMR